MLSTIREFALERLEQRGELAERQRRHAAYFVELAERAGPELAGPQRARWFARLERELDDLRAALAWTLDNGEAEMGLRLSEALRPFWEEREGSVLVLLSGVRRMGELGGRT